MASLEQLMESALKTSAKYRLRRAALSASAGESQVISEVFRPIPSRIPETRREYVYCESCDSK